MRIRDISIRNLKGVAEFDLTDAPDIVVLGGPNGVGKSTVLDAIAAFYSVSYWGRFNQKGIVTKGKDVGEVRIKFSLYPEEKDYLKRIGMSNTSDELEGYVRWNASGNAFDHYSSNNALWQLTQFNDRKSYPNVGILDYNDPHRIFPRKSITSISFTGLGIDERQNRIAPGDQKYGFLKDHLIQLAESDGRHIRTLARKQYGSLDISSVPDPLDEFRQMFNRLLAPKKFLDINFKENPPQFEVETPFGVVDIDELSSGEREIAFVFGEFMRLHLSNSIILFDEPDLHLNEQIQRRIIPELQKLGPNNQIWLTTHSLGIMDSAPYNSLFRMEYYSGKNQVQNAFDSQDRLGLFQSVAGSAGLVTIAQRIIFTEGKTWTDHRVYSSYFPHLRGKIAFVPSDSVKEVESISYKLLKLLESEPGYNFYYALRDRDYLDDQSRSSIMKQGNNRIYVLQRYHIENYLLDWDIISIILSRNLASSPFTDGNSVKREFYRLVKEDKMAYLGQMISYALNSHVLYGIKHFNIGGAKIIETAQEQAKRTRDHVLSKVTNDEVNRIASEQSGFLDKWLDSDDWAIRLPGRDMIQSFLRTNAKDIKYEIFKNQLVSEISKNPPKELKQVMGAFLGENPFPI